MKQVEGELKALKSKCERLTKIENELKAMRDDFTIIKAEHAILRVDRNDVQEHVYSVDNYLGQCLEIMDTTVRKLQIVEESVSDLQEKDSNCNSLIVSDVSKATAGARTRASSPENNIGFGAAFSKRMDEMQAAVLKRMDQTHATVLKRMDTIEATAQLRHDQTKASEERNHKELIAIVAKESAFSKQTLGPAENVDFELLTNTAKKMEDVLGHSMAVVSCEAKLENLEQLVERHNTSTESVINGLDARLDGLKKQITDLGGQNVHESIDIDDKFNTLYRNGDIKGLGNLINMVSKLSITMEAFDNTLRNVSVSDTSLQNILQWVQSMNNKVVDMSGKIEGRSGKGIDSLLKAVSSLATKADLQFMAAILKNSAPGKETKKSGAAGTAKSVSTHGVDPGKTNRSSNPPIQNATVTDKPKPKLATTLGLSWTNPVRPKPESTPMLSPAGPSQPRGVQPNITPEESNKVMSAETVKGRKEEMAVYEQGATEEKATNAAAVAVQVDQALEQLKSDAKVCEVERGEIDYTDSDSEDSALFTRFADMKRSMQSSTSMSSSASLDQAVETEIPVLPTIRATSTPIALKATTNTNLKPPSMSPTHKATSNLKFKTLADLNAQATDFKMPGSFSPSSQSPFEGWKDVGLGHRFADSY